MAVKSYNKKLAFGDKEMQDMAIPLTQGGDISEESLGGMQALVDNGRIAMRSPGTRNEVVKVLAIKKDNPVEAVADAAHKIFNSLETSANASGKELMDDVKAFGGYGIVEEVAKVAEQAQLFTLNEEEVGQAFQQAMQKYLVTGVKQGKIDPIQLQKDVEPLYQMQQEGKLSPDVMKRPGGVASGALAGRTTA